MRLCGLSVCTVSLLLSVCTVSPSAILALWLISRRPQFLCLIVVQEKAAHREAYGSLRGVKAEVDGVQAMLEQARVRLQRDFQAWYATMARSGGSGSSDGVPKHGMEHAAAAPAGEQQVVGRKDGSWSPSQQHLKLQHEGQDWSIPAVAPGSARSPGTGWQRGEAAPPLAAAALPLFSSWKAAPSFFFDQQQGPADSSPVVTPGCAALGPASSPTQGAVQPRQQPQPQLPPPPLQLVAEAAPPDPFAGVEAEVLSAARPLLTGNSQADADIVKFYQARHALLRSTR